MALGYWEITVVILAISLILMLFYWFFKIFRKIEDKTIGYIEKNRSKKVGYFKRQKLQKQIFNDASVKAESIGNNYYKEWSKWKIDMCDPAMKELKMQYNEEFLKLLEESERRMLEMYKEGNWKQSNEEAIRYKQEKKLIDKKFTIQFNALKENSKLQLFRLINKYDTNYPKIKDEVKHKLGELGFSDKQVEDLIIWDDTIGDAHSKNGSKPSNERYLIKETIENIIEYKMPYAISNRGLD